MRILFDQGTPVPLRASLAGHEVRTAFEMGWSDLDHGELLAAAETAFDVLITTDQNLRFQQNLAGRRVAIVVLPTTSWPRILEHVAEVATALDGLRPGDYENAFEHWKGRARELETLGVERGRVHDPVAISHVRHRAEHLAFGRQAVGRDGPEAWSLRPEACLELRQAEVEQLHGRPFVSIAPVLGTRGSVLGRFASPMS